MKYQFIDHLTDEIAEVSGEPGGSLTWTGPAPLIATIKVFMAVSNIDPSRIESFSRAKEIFRESEYYEVIEISEG